MEYDFIESHLAQDAIDAARLVTDITGGLHEFQAKQLKTWPLLVFEEAESCEAGVDIGVARHDMDDAGRATRRNRPVRIEYRVSTGGKDHTPELQAKWARGASLLVRFTRTLFWPDTDVTVLIDNYQVKPHE